MNRLKLKVPVNSLNSAKQQIKAGADEIYLSFTSGYFNNFSFSGRGKDTYGKAKSEVDYDEFKEIIKLAHDNNVIVELAANTCRMMDVFDGSGEFQNEYLKYVEKGVAAGIDRVIVGDFGCIVEIKKNFPDIPITAGVFFQTFNSYHVKLLDSLGVKKIVLDHCITIPEAEELVKCTNVPLEVFCQFGCSFMQVSCGLFHSGVKKINLGIPCRAKYSIKNTGESIKILDVGEDCSICALPKLRDIGISSIKIAGRDIDYKYCVSLTHIYSSVLSMLEQNMRMEEILDALFRKFNLDWWKEGYCENKRCKYGHKEYHI
jgi:putative protease